MRQFFRLLLPEKAELLVYFSLGLLLLLLQNVRRIWTVLNGKTAVINTHILGTNNILVIHFKNFENGISPEVVSFAVWLLIGCIVYIFISFIIAILKSTEDEAELVHYYKFPNGKNHEINAFLTKVAVRIAGVICLILWISLFLKTINPYVNRTLYFAFNSTKEIHELVKIPLVFILYVVCLYLFAVITRLIFLKIRIFGQESE